MRLSKDGGKTYRTSAERRLTETLPSLPAAVRTCGPDGMVRTICLDLDSSRGGQDNVDRDYRELRQWFTAQDVRWIEDQSPSGGRHLYLPLASAVVFTDAKEFVQALSRRFSSLDPGPHENAATGAIRVPGSLWKKGGYQRLTMSLNSAYKIARAGRNERSSWDNLRKDLRQEIESLRLRRTRPLQLLDSAETTARSGGPRALPPAKEAMARSGNYDPGRYASASEARQSVLASAAAAGWELTDVQRLMHQNIWAGMTAFYSRYSPTHRLKALHRDWRNAITYIRSFTSKPNRSTDGSSNQYKSYTSPLNTHPLPALVPSQPSTPAEYQFLASWRNALRFHEQSLIGSRAGLGARMLLRALGEAAAKTGSRFVEFGVRSLALATGTHETTVARQLRETAAGAGMIRLAGEGRGVKADLYELVIPEQYQHRSATTAWRPGKVHALRPVFRELGIVCAFVYETIEQNPGALTGAQISRISGLSPSAVAQALEVMAAWNMVHRDDGQWNITTATSLRALAERFGVLNDIAVQTRRYRMERALWHQWLAKRMLSRELTLVPDSDDYPYWRYGGPPEDEQTLWDISDRRAS